MDMLTAMLNGSPHAGGDTAQLVAALRAGLTGRVEEVRAYSSGISPCVDCRWRRAQLGCALRDGMQRVYALLERADNVVIASPVHYSELAGRLLDLASRLQTCYSHAVQGRAFAAQPPPARRDTAGGGEGEPDAALMTARRLMRAMGVREPLVALSLAADRVPAAQDAAALRAAREAGRALSMAR